jgi:hypothetical protein
MMGDRLIRQESLFYQFRLDDHIPTNHKRSWRDTFGPPRTSRDC